MQISELARRLEHRLASCQTSQDLADLICQIKAFTSGSSYSSEDKKVLSRIRQRAYDRKRRLPSQKAKLSESAEQPDARSLLPDARQESLETRCQMFGKPTQCSSVIESSDHDKQEVTKKTERKEAKMPESRAVNGAGISKDVIGEWKGGVAQATWDRFVKMLPKCFFLTTGSLLIGWLLWLQSVDLYQASGFASPGLVALGGIVMMAGFAAFHSVFPSKLAMMCCLYAGGYEAYFVVSGTISSERSSKVTQELSKNGISWLQEQLSRHKAEYERVKARYDAPGSKEHMNGWFKKTYVDPKWEQYSSSQAKLQDTLAAIESKIEFDHVGLRGIASNLHHIP